MTLEGKLRQKLLWSDGDGYESARLAAVWNGLKPSRRPAGIVLAEGADDVVTAMLLAQERALQVSVRAGGHSTSAAGVREGALLIDVSRLKGLDVDVEARTAVVGPGITGRDIDAALDPLGLYFPHGHCSSVAMGGFLTGGGLGWNSRATGPACSMVRAVEVVTANGETVRADETHNSDLYWAVRGAGPGFFGVVTAFHLELLPKPAVIKIATQNYPLEVADELLGWLYDTRHELAPIVDQSLCVTQHMTNSPHGPTMSLSSFAFADSEREADEALALFVNAPLRSKAIWGVDDASVESMGDLTMTDDLYPDGFRYSHHNVLSNAPATALAPVLAPTFTTLPTPRSHINWINFVGLPQVPDMAFSLSAETLIEAVTVWDDPDQDARMQSWAIDHTRRLEPLAVGSQISADSMASRGLGAEAYFTADRLTRLNALRDHWDPAHRFVSFLLG